MDEYTPWNPCGVLHHIDWSGDIQWRYVNTYGVSLLPYTLLHTTSGSGVGVYGVIPPLVLLYLCTCECLWMNTSG